METPAANALQAGYAFPEVDKTSSLQKSADDETNIAALTEPIVSKKRDWLSGLQTAECHFKHWSLSRVKCCRIWTNRKKLIQYLAVNDVMEINAHKTQKTDVLL